MAMTTAQRATVRRRTSATTTEISDAELDAIYDDTAQGNSSLDYTTFYVLRDLRGIVAGAVDVSNQVDEMSIKSSQRWDHVEKLYLDWGMLLGLGVPLDLAIVAGGIAATCGEYIDCVDCP